MNQQIELIELPQQGTGSNEGRNDFGHNLVLNLTVCRLTDATHSVATWDAKKHMPIEAQHLTLSRLAWIESGVIMKWET